MKRIATPFRIFLILFALSTATCSAQSFQRGQVDINLGIGLGATFLAPDNDLFLPPVSASVEVGITNDISIGGYLGFAGSRYKYSGWENCPHYGQDFYTDTHSWSYLILGVRGAYHFGRFIKVDKLDVYAGLMLGNDFARETYTTNSPCPDHAQVQYDSGSYGGLVASLFAGARYRFTNHFGVFGELGYGITILNIGLNFKF